MTDINNTVLISGGTGLLGSAIADVFIDSGYRIIITSRTFENAAEFCNKRAKDGGQERWIPLELDLSDPTSISHAVETLAEMNVYPSRLVANASARDALGPSFEDLDHSDFSDLLEVDVAGHMMFARELRDTSPESSTLASLTFMSSIYAIQGVDTRIYPEEMAPTPVHYSTAKSAMNGLARSLASRWGPATRVNVVIAGGIRAEDRQHPEFTDAYIEKTMANRLAEPEEIADAIFFLSSENASYITGQSLIVDGGYSAW